MSEAEKVINDLNTAKLALCNPQLLTTKIRVRMGQAITSAIALLEKQETTLEKDGHHIRCLNCGEYWCDNDAEGNPFPINFCPNCGRSVKQND